MAEKKEISNAVLVPDGPSIAQFVIQQLLNGLKVQVEINGKPYVGFVHQLDFGQGADYVFANVWIRYPDDKDEHISEHISLRVSISVDGSVNIMPNQPND